MTNNPQQYTGDAVWVTSLTLDGRELLTGPIPFRMAGHVIAANIEPEFVITAIDYTGDSLIGGGSIPMAVFTAPENDPQKRE